MLYKAPSDVLKSKAIPSKDQETLLQNISSVIIINIATSGISLEKRGEILEIAAVKINIEDGLIKEEFSTYVKPHLVNSIGKKITENTGITNNDVKNAPYIQDVIPILYEFIGDSVIAGHDINFSWHRFLMLVMQKGGRICPNDTICVMALAKRLQKGLNSYKMVDLCKENNISHNPPYNSLSNARAVGLLCCKLKGETGKPTIKQEPVITNIPFAQKEQIWIGKATPYKGKTASSGNFIYFHTSIGQVVYSVKNDILGISELTVAKNVDMDMLKSLILEKFKAKGLNDIWDLISGENKATRQIECLVPDIESKIKNLEKKNAMTHKESKMYGELVVMKQNLVDVKSNLKATLLKNLEPFVFFHQLDNITEPWENCLTDEELDAFQNSQMEQEVLYDSFMGYVESYTQTNNDELIIKACYSFLHYYGHSKRGFFQYLNTCIPSTTSGN